MDNVFYFNSINAIGGVESFFYYLSKQFKNIVVYYKKADSNQIKRLAKNIEVRKFKGERIKCKRFFCNYGFDIKEYVDAEEYYFVIHCDYKKNKICKPFIYDGFKYIGVSKLASNSFTELTGLPAETIYNPISIDNPHVEKKTDKIHIICATRLSSEKGGWRIDKLAEMLDKAKVDYDLTVYTNKPNKIHFQSDNVIVKKPKLDLTKEMQEATYVMQLSDHEAFGLTVAESLILGTPVIITDIPAFHEIGCNETNSIMVDLDLKNVDIEAIKKGKKPFCYTPPKSTWNKYLDNNRDYDPNKETKVKVKRGKLYLIEEDKHVVKNDEILLPRYRASELEAKGYIEICD